MRAAAAVLPVLLLAGCAATPPPSVPVVVRAVHAGVAAPVPTNSAAPRASVLRWRPGRREATLVSWGTPPCELEPSGLQVRSPTDAALRLNGRVGPSCPVSDGWTAVDFTVPDGISRTRPVAVTLLVGDARSPVVLPPSPVLPVD